MVVRDIAHRVDKEAAQVCADEVCYQSCEQCVARHVSMCSALEEADLQSVADISKNVETGPKQLICAEGEEAEHLYNIKSDLHPIGPRGELLCSIMSHLFGTQIRP